MSAITAVVMPKWGLSMEEGKVSMWHVSEGDRIEPGTEIADIETSKIANIYESPAGGTVRRLVVPEGDAVPVGALIAVLAEDDVPEDEIDAFIAGFEVVEPDVEEGGGLPEPSFAETAGGSLRYLRLGEGEGPAVVFVHGYGSDLNVWAYNQPQLAAAHDTVALDLPGHGASTKAVPDGSVAALAGSLAQLFEALDLDRVHLVGHSLGAALAARLAIDRPERVASLTLIAPAGVGETINGEFIDGFRTAERRKALKAVLEMLVADPGMLSRDLVREVQRFKRLDGVDAALGAIAAACFPGGRQTTDLRAGLAELKLPIQAIWGAADRIVPVAQLEGLPDNIRRHVLDGVGHLPQMERPGEVNRLIRELVEG